VGMNDVMNAKGIIGFVQRMVLGHEGKRVEGIHSYQCLSSVCKIDFQLIHCEYDIKFYLLFK
jgi:hypothetical protein